jgi:Tfp pilus assembly protein PilV
MIFLKNKNKNKNKNKGFVMVEVIVAVSIITASVLAAMAVTQKSIYLSRQSLHQAQSALLLEEGAENARIARDNGFDNLLSLDSSISQIGIFSRNISVENVKRDITSLDISDTGQIDDGTKLVTITVSWQEGNETITKSLSFYLSDIFS